MSKPKKNSSEVPSDFDDTKPWESFYGNGKVFVARGSRHIELNGANFDFERLYDKGGADGDYWITSETVVALGFDVSRKQAVNALKNIIGVLQDKPSGVIEGRIEKKRMMRKRKQRANR
jgi:hypothetical protein